MTEVSVVIPCYNARPFIEEALFSVASQSRVPDEVIVVDDGSTDGAAEVAELYGVHVIRTRVHRGVAAARNIGLRAARGPLIAWLDADDKWEPDHLATVVPLLERFPEAVLAFARVRMFGSESGVWPAWLPAEVLVAAESACLRRCILPQNALVVRREQVLSAGGYDERLSVAEDYDLWLRLAGKYPFVCTHSITCNWRRHAAQTSGEIEQYWKGEYDSRRRYRESNAAILTSKELGRLDDEMLAVWKEHLSSAWHSRQMQHFDFHLSMADNVPGARRFKARYRRRRHLIAAARLLDSCPQSVRNTILSLRRSLKQRGDRT